MPPWMKWAIALLIGVGIISAGFRFAPWLLNVFFILNCFVLIIVVLLQSGKAADLAGAFGGAGSQTAFGPRGAANVLSRATTWCAIMFMLCAMAMTLRTDKAIEQGGSILQKVAKPVPKPAPATIPAVPQPNTHNALPPGQQPAVQPPASQTPVTTLPSNNPPASQTPAGQPSQQAPAKPQSSSQPPASSQPAAPAPTKKP
jgi:preprotein translocase subunit SecG